MCKILTILFMLSLPAFSGEVKKAAPVAAFKVFTMDGELFSCNVPSGWQQERDLKKEKRDKTLQLELLGPRADKSPVIIYAAFYLNSGNYFKNYKDYIDKNSKDSWGETEDRYSAVNEIKLGGRKAFVFDREVKTSLNPEASSGETVQIIEKFYLIPAKEGFYALHFYAPKSVYKQYLPVFERLAKSFKGKP